MSELEPTNIPGLYKDKNTSVFINKNLGEYERVVAARSKKLADNQLRREVSSLKQDMNELKESIKILTEILRKDNG